MPSRKPDADALGAPERARDSTEQAHPQRLARLCLPDLPHHVAPGSPSQPPPSFPPRPLALTTDNNDHIFLAATQVCCALTGAVLVQLRLLGLKPVDAITSAVYLKRIVPIGLLYALTLAMGNGAYLYLTVSFIQMLKASSPVIVYFASVFATLEAFSWSRFLNMVVISVGICIASYGEINLNVAGMSLQLLSITAEAVRIVLIQILLQRQGLKLNPVLTMYYVAPACILCLLPAAAFLELPSLSAKLKSGDELPAYGLFALNGVGAVSLNLTVYLVLGQMPALMMNAAGVVKDWLLIYLSRLIFASPVTEVQLGGYTLAFLAVVYYNYTREMEKRRQQQQQHQREEEGSEKDAKEEKEHKTHQTSPYNR